MEKLAHELVEIAVKTADKPALEDRCLKALSKLYTLRVTNQFFLYTGAGNLMHSLKSNPHRKPVIREYADRVFIRWMRQLYSHSPEKTTQIPTPAPNSKPQNKTKALQNPKPIAVALSRKNEAAACLKKPTNSPKMPNEAQEKSPDVSEQMRKNIGQQIFEGLCLALKETNLKSSEFDPVGIAVLVESTLFGVWGGHCQKYRSFLYNLKDPRNPDFRRKILTRKIKPEKIATMKAEDMASDEKRIKNHFIREAALNKCIVGRQAVC